MKIFLPTFAALFCLIFNGLMAQDSLTVANPDSIYLIVDQPPEFIGGSEALMGYLGQNLRYPSEAKEAGISGKIYVQFVVEANGTISNETILRGIGGGCDEEALQVIHGMPAWSPGIQNGVPVRVVRTLPINFSLGASLPSQTKIYLEADSLPEFVGGEDALYAYLSEQVTDYFILNNMLEEHLVNVYFVVEPDGSITNVMVRDSVGNGLDEVAIDIVQNMPAWIPGKIGQTNIRMIMYVPVEFPPAYTVVESMPEYPGGMDKMISFVVANLKYPLEAKEKGIQGGVFVHFVIEGDGSVSNLRVLKGIGGGCDEEAIRVLRLMPKWTPGKQRGKPVRVSYNFSVRFKL
ncbi:MAG: energy transducer TonB [Bacteroidales bacterium]|nr:energy transducer TonB [Bacteroidales bacterium]